MTVVPFPHARNRAFVIKQARYIASLNHGSGERYLQQQLDLQCATMERRRIAPDRIREERRRLEAAIRAALCRLEIRRPGGAA
jgi:hypothetical protein